MMSNDQRRSSMHTNIFSDMLRPPLAVIASALLTASTCWAQNNDGSPPKLGPRVQTDNAMEIEPSGPKPDWAPTIDPQMLAVIEQFVATEPPAPATKLSPFQFRNIVLPAEAAAALAKKAGIPPQEPETDISHRVLPVGPDEGILVRIYTPLDAQKPLPVIVYYHGGGWVIADLDTYEPSARALAERTGAVVVSVAYRQAPDHKFPTAHEDSFAAYKWVTEKAEQIGGDPNRIATAGESAGGNLAVAVALMAKERRAPLPVHILSVYPIADGDVQSPSYDKYANAKPLSRPLME
jgi:acetyl esterase